MSDAQSQRQAISDRLNGAAENATLVAQLARGGSKTECEMVDNEDGTFDEIHHSSRVVVTRSWLVVLRTLSTRPVEVVQIGSVYDHTVRFHDEFVGNNVRVGAWAAAGLAPPAAFEFRLRPRDTPPPPLPQPPPPGPGAAAPPRPHLPAGGRHDDGHRTRASPPCSSGARDAANAIRAHAHVLPRA